MNPCTAKDERLCHGRAAASSIASPFVALRVVSSSSVRALKRLRDLPGFAEAVAESRNEGDTLYNQRLRDVGDAVIPSIPQISSSLTLEHLATAIWYERRVASHRLSLVPAPRPSAVNDCEVPS